jgi:hypothetical protein
MEYWSDGVLEKAKGRLFCRKIIRDLKDHHRL